MITMIHLVFHHFGSRVSFQHLTCSDLWLACSCSRLHESFLQTVGGDWVFAVWGRDKLLGAWVSGTLWCTFLDISGIDTGIGVLSGLLHRPAWISPCPLSLWICSLPICCCWPSLHWGSFFSSPSRLPAWALIPPKFWLPSVPFKINYNFWPWLWNASLRLWWIVGSILLGLPFRLEALPTGLLRVLALPPLLTTTVWPLRFLASLLLFWIWLHLCVDLTPGSEPRGPGLLDFGHGLCLQAALPGLALAPRVLWPIPSTWSSEHQVSRCHWSVPVGVTTATWLGISPGTLCPTALLPWQRRRSTVQELVWPTPPLSLNGGLNEELGGGRGGAIPIHLATRRSRSRRQHSFTSFCGHAPRRRISFGPTHRLSAFGGFASIFEQRCHYDFWSSHHLASTGCSRRRPGCSSRVGVGSACDRCRYRGCGWTSSAWFGWRLRGFSRGSCFPSRSKFAPSFDKGLDLFSDVSKDRLLLCGRRGGPGNPFSRGRGGNREGGRARASCFQSQGEGCSSKAEASYNGSFGRSAGVSCPDAASYGAGVGLDAARPGCSERGSCRPEACSSPSPQSAAGVFDFAGLCEDDGDATEGEAGGGRSSVSQTFDTSNGFLCRSRPRRRRCQGGPPWPAQSWSRARPWLHWWRSCRLVEIPCWTLKEAHRECL